MSALGLPEPVGRLATEGSQPADKVHALYKSMPAVACRQKPAYPGCRYRRTETTETRQGYMT